ncbi:GGDEF domain-containing protein [Egicoccus halophilus]|uniref:Diguanylate cyclase (GGDEF) domain-containing protein n=1 Tax=Egicoccus halophilus TaxID=1670830 RepID=A0A8J3EUY4_9ACTN|nr:GGDEF domain-containing protein [Egicoccus halophilus]GGI08108.1 hypothetical protein GCM10011354_27450 [Egicoccus halophilus]
MGHPTLPAGYAACLAMTSTGAPLGTVLQTIVEMIEADLPGSLGSVMLLGDDDRLRVAAAPSLPAAWIERLAEGVPPDPRVGSCGRAAALLQPVVSANIPTDPAWRDFAADAVASGLRACWSTPIIGLQGALGSFGVYFPTPRRPVGQQLQQLAGYAQIAAVAVQNAVADARNTGRDGADPLTGLRDANALERLVTDAVADGDLVTVLMVEVGRLRECNAAFGPAAGDELLRQAAQRLCNLNSAARTFRLFGDEFALVLPGVDAATGRLTAERTLQALRAPYAVAGTGFTAAPRVGLVSQERPGTPDTEGLLAGARAALRTAVRSGTDLEVHAEPTTRDGRLADHIGRENRLRDGLAAGEVVLHYQPQYDLTSGTLVAAEALVRWEHPEEGLLLPGAFLHVLATGHLRRALTEVVLEQACRDLATWGADTHGVSVAVNVSADELTDPDLVDRVRTLLRRHGVPGTALQVEITEQVVFADLSSLRRTIEGLRALDVRVSIDDFGTGYSSLHHARQLPVDALKIDRSFVRGCVEDPHDASVIASVVGLAEGLGVDVVAEGVETEAQLEAVRRLGCDLGQGFLWSPAVPPEQFHGLLTARPAPTSTPPRVVATAPPPITPPIRSVGAPSIAPPIAPAIASMGAPPFAAAAEAVVHYLADHVPFGLWAVTRYDGERQRYLYVADRAYGLQRGGAHAWEDAYCTAMVAGEAPPIAPDAAAVPRYAAAGINRQVKIGAYAGVPLWHADGELFGSLCGVDPDRQSERLHDHQPLLELLGELLSSVLAGEERTTAATSTHLPTRQQRQTGRELAPASVPEGPEGWQQRTTALEERFSVLGDPASVLVVHLGSTAADQHDGQRRAVARVLAEHRTAAEVVAALDGRRFAVLLRRPPRATAAVADAVADALHVAGVRAAVGHAPVEIGGSVADALRAADARTDEHRTRRRAG